MQRELRTACKGRGAYPAGKRACRQVEAEPGRSSLDDLRWLHGAPVTPRDRLSSPAAYMAGSEAVEPPCASRNPGLRRPLCLATCRVALGPGPRRFQLPRWQGAPVIRVARKYCICLGSLRHAWNRTVPPPRPEFALFLSLLSVFLGGLPLSALTFSSCARMVILYLSSIPRGSCLPCRRAGTSHFAAPCLLLLGIQVSSAFVFVSSPLPVVFTTVCVCMAAVSAAIGFVRRLSLSAIYSTTRAQACPVSR